MAGIMNTDLRSPRIRKWIWISIIIVVLLICGLFLVPDILFKNFQVEQRVAASVHMIPGANFRYSDTTDQNGFMKVKKFIYWINSPFEQVKDFPFVTNFRESSDPNIASAPWFIHITPNYSYRAY